MVRIKKRYLLIELIEEDDNLKKYEELPVDQVSFLNSLRNAIKTIHGEFGLASVFNSLHCKKFNANTRVALVSCRRGPHYLLLTSLPFIKSIGDFSITLNLLHLSGTIQASLKFLRKYYYQQVKKNKYDLKMVEHLKSFEKAVVLNKYENE